MISKIHSEFKLNGSRHTVEGLHALAEDWIKNGLPYEQEIGNFLWQWLDASTTIQVTTSGSTGVPKVISLQKTHMVNSAIATGAYFKLKARMNALLCLSATYIAGKMMLVRAMVLGLELDCISPSMSPLGGSTKTYDFTAMVPLQLENSLAKIDTIKTVIVGGAALSNTLKEKVASTATKVFETYGMTETITHVAIRAVRSGDIAANFKALPNVMFSADGRGCLVISAPKIAKQPIITNDSVRLISETEFDWLGRYDNVINSGGIKLFPEQIEAKLTKHISNRFFVTAIADEALGQKVVLIIEGAIDSEKLLQKLQQEKIVARFETPKAVYTIPKFIETKSGKISRNKTLALIQS